MLHHHVTHSDKRIQVRTVVLLAIILASLSFFCKTAYAVPMTTNFQGFLKDVQDKPLTANVNLSFTLYDALTGGTALWAETHSGTPVQDGVFSVILGSSQPIPENILQKTLYLGIKVNADPEMQPRQTITGSLFAMRAGVAETVVKGAITSDSLTAGSVTMEKVADGAIGSSKLAASAVTGTNIAPNAVTADKIPDATITTEKLSADVQQKLAQSGSMPSSVATLNVTDKIKVGTNSLYLNGSAQPAGTPNNSIHTDNGALFLQSKTDNNQNTVINAGNTGNVGIGTSNAKVDAKLEVQGPFKLSKTDGNKIFANPPYTPGLYMFYNQNTYTAEFHSLAIGDAYGSNNAYSDISLNGRNIFINEKQSGDNNPTGKVGIGLMSGNKPEGQLTVNGPHSPSNDLLVLSSTGTDTNYQWGYSRFGNERWFPYWSCNTKLENDKWYVDIGSFNGSATKIQHGWNNISFQYYKHSSNQQGAPAYVWKEFESPGWKTALLMDSNTGNIGIGTTTPKAKLSVAGKVAINRDDISTTYYDPASTVSINGSVDLGGNDHFRIGPWDIWQTTVSNGSSLYIDRLSGLGNSTYIRETMCRFGWDKTLHCAGGFYNNSDKRLKDDIKPLEDSLSKVSKLQGVSYLLKPEASEEKVRASRKIGFIAQDVEPVLPELVSTDEKGFKGVAYDKMTAVLVEAIKELKAQNDALKAIVCKDHPQEAICR